MNPLASIYGGVVALRNTAYDLGWRHAQRLSGPVISVGNISAGGTGKTPFVLLLGRLLERRDIKFDVLSRGYGRRTRGVQLVDPAGSAADFGDEPLLIARRLQAPVIVGESRVEAGRFAEAKFGPRLHLLDDGFQHRSLARDFDIVMLGTGDTHDGLLPAGRLREPLSALTRADAVVVEGDGRLPPDATGKFIWRVSRDVSLPSPPARPIVFCGIARPERFVDQLRARGLNPVATRFFSDHHAYAEDEIRSLLALKTQKGSDGFVTTEKDAINLEGCLSALMPLIVAQVTMDLADADAVLDGMLQTVADRRRSS